MSTWWQRIVASLRPAHDDAPIVEAARAMTIKDVVRRFWPRLRPLRWWLVLSVLLASLIPAIQVAEVLLFQRLVDDVLVPADARPLLVLALLYIGLNLASGVVDGLDDYLSTWISQKFLVGLRRDAYAHVLHLPAVTSDKRRLGDVLTRLTSDVAAVESFMVGQLAGGVSALIKLTFFVGALFWLQWELALASMVVVPFFWMVSTSFARFTKDVSRERRRRGGSLTSLTEESLANAALVQTYERTGEAVSAYDRQNQGIARAELAAARVRSLFLPLVDLAELLGVLLVIGLGVWALATDRLTLGGLLAFLTLLMQCYRPIRDLADLLPGLFSATAGVERLVELLDEPGPTERAGAVSLPAGPGEVEFREVCFAYAGQRRPALESLSLRIAAGERVAVMGPSGSGKSTMARLLSRQVEALSGAVLIDGHDVLDATAASVRAAVTPVHQEQLVIDASVADNIAFAAPDASLPQVRDAARRADAHAFIESLPQGYDTRVGQRGRSLSGGQRQRISLARAFLRDSRVLVLDEPTTGLDEASSRRLLERLTSGPRDRTLIIATHDPVVADYVDRVVRLAPDDLQPTDPDADQLTTIGESPA